MEQFWWPGRFCGSYAKAWRHTVEGKSRHRITVTMQVDEINYSHSYIQSSPASQKPRETGQYKPGYYTETHDGGHVKKEKEEKLQESNRFMNADTSKPSFVRSSPQCIHALESSSSQKKA